MGSRNVLLITDNNIEPNPLKNQKNVLKYKCDKIYEMYAEGENTNILIEK